jgi:hypothetical protein
LFDAIIILTIREHNMAGKATSVYLTVSNKTTHKTEFHKVFFNMSGLNQFVATDEFKALWPETEFYITKETY